MAARTQRNRIARLTTPLGPDVLVLTRFEASEGLSELFEIRVTAVGGTASVDMKSVVGTACGVTIDNYGGKRHFHGIAAEVRWQGDEDEEKQYSLVLRPMLWLLTQSSDCKIFKNHTVPDILKAVFAKHELSDYSLSLSNSYNPIEYCVQYNETDFDFVARLLEQNGIYYYFKFGEDAHTLVLTDSKAGHAADDTKIGYSAGTEGSPLEAQHFHRFSGERRLRTGKVVLGEYDFLQSAAALNGEDSKDSGYPFGGLEVFHYPGKYPRSGTLDLKKRADGTMLAQVSLGAQQALDQRRYAEGDAVGLFPGHKFTFEDHPEAGDYVVVRARHRLSQEAYTSGEGGAAGEFYAGDYELQPDDRDFRAPLTTPRPLVRGPQTATVVGKDGEEIDVDKYGRVLLQFQWDRASPPEQSRRVRVAQVWAGAGWGGQVIPRIGQEVVVEFLDGDPDRPLVVGAVYNDRTPLPYPLPGNETVAGLKSNSSKGGGGYNELMFDDKKSSELVRMQAQRDLQATILNSETRTIGQSFEKAAKGDPSRTTVLKKGDDALTVEQGNLKVTVSQGDHLTTVSTGKQETVVSAGDHVTTVSKGNQTNTVSLGNQTVEIEAGNQKITVGQSISMQADLKIELKVGGTTLTLDASGVTVKAPMVQIQADAMLKAEAPMAQVNADGVLMLKGGITMIN
ncbi:MAG TPA: type VI secretion system tip protein TssI/VgrG [Lichenihabitans sp.]|jgi:type VI secretion system secreted protein VgrG|nr:type VI secretion system tip protein TssI/VgrG [Lichenihabitans sp.]